MEILSRTKRTAKASIFSFVFWISKNRFSRQSTDESERCYFGKDKLTVISSRTFKTRTLDDIWSSRKIQKIRNKTCRIGRLRVRSSGQLLWKFFRLRPFRRVTRLKFNDFDVWVKKKWASASESGASGPGPSFFLETKHGKLNITWQSLFGYPFLSLLATIFHHYECLKLQLNSPCRRLDNRLAKNHATYGSGNALINVRQKIYDVCALHSKTCLDCTNGLRSRLAHFAWCTSDLVFLATR